MHSYIRNFKSFNKRKTLEVSQSASVHNGFHWKTDNERKTLEVSQRAFVYKEFHWKSVNERKTLEVLKKAAVQCKSLSKFDKMRVARVLRISALRCAMELLSAEILKKTFFYIFFYFFLVFFYFFQKHFQKNWKKWYSVFFF